MSRMRIVIGSEHAGYQLKQALISSLLEAGFDVMGMGSESETPVDYPTIAEELGRMVVSGAYEKGILICGTGIGMSIAANKVKGIRAALCHDVYAAQMSRLHNDANVLCLGSWMIGKRLAEVIATTFLNTPFEGGRHIPRVEKIAKIERSDQENLHEC